MFLNRGWIMFKTAIASAIFVLVTASTVGADFGIEDILDPGGVFHPRDDGNILLPPTPQQARQRIEAIINNHPEFIQEQGRILLEFTTSLTGNPIQDAQNTLATLDRMRRGLDAVVNGPLLGEWLIYSRNDARSTGFAPIPPHVKTALRGYYSDLLLDRVGYKVGQGGEFNLASLSIKYGDAAAVTLVDTIIFADEAGTNDIALWAHEMKHVEQFAAMGVYEFAERYIHSYTTIENEAYAAGDLFGGTPDLGTAGTATTTNICETTNGTCELGAAYPVGTACSCPTGVGDERVIGQFR